MDREIVLSSYSVKETSFNKPENFVTKSTRPIILPSNNEYQLGLNRIINMSFTWFNVNPSYKNQAIAYSISNGANLQNVVLPPGVWNYTDFDSYIKKQLTTFRVTIKVPVGFRLDLTKSDFNDLIGFDKKNFNKRNTYWY